MTASKPFKIILRYGLDPFNGLEENLKQLETFIQESTINEVMFLLMPEERSSGHPNSVTSLRMTRAGMLVTVARRVASAVSCDAEKISGVAAAMRIFAGDSQ